MFLPWKHSPDGNVYYLVTLRILQGNFTESIDGVFSPLLSWFMVIPSLFGTALPDAYRIVNCLAFGVLLWATSSLSKKFKFSPLLHGLILVLTTLECAYLSLRLITSDLLAAGLVVLFVDGLVADQQGARRTKWYSYSVLISLVYLAKAFQLPIILGSLIASWFFVLRRGAGEFARPTWIVCIIVMALALCAPWVAVLSVKYGAFTLSAQQFIYHRQLPLEYSPFNQPVLAAGADSRHLAVVAAPSLLSESLRRIVVGTTELRRGATTAVFGDVGLWFFIGMLFISAVAASRASEQAAECRLLWIFAVVPFVFYLPIWGGSLRYYFPSLPLLNLLVVRAISQTDAVIRLWRVTAPNRVRWGAVMAYRALVSITIIGIVYQSVSLVVRDWSSTSDHVVKWAANLPELRDGAGTIAGFEVSDPYPSLIAAVLGRPMWLYVGLHMQDAPRRLQELLARETISQVVVSGGRNTHLEEVPGIEFIGVFSQPSYSFALYHFGPSPAEIK